MPIILEKCAKFLHKTCDLQTIFNYKNAMFC